jgi:acetaldehyde dehydrogenase / alcohol dehydrogenase
LLAGALGGVGGSDPATEAVMLRWVSRHALGNNRVLPGDGEQVIGTGEPDPAVDALVARSAAALDSIAGWPEEEIDGLITALAAQIAAHADELAAATVAETGIGCVPDKADKNRFASLGVARSLTGKPGVGVASSNAPEGLTEIAEPMGVILGLIPATNPVATLVFKALICIKARDALIASCHRDAAGVGAQTADLLRRVLARHGACVDLVQAAPRHPGRRATAALMRHPGVAMILATGGTAMVKAAYSSGTPGDRGRAGQRAGLGLRRRRRGQGRPDRRGQQGLRPRHHLRLGEQPHRRPVGPRLLHRCAARGRRGRARPRRLRPPGPGGLR